MCVLQVLLLFIVIAVRHLIISARFLHIFFLQHVYPMPVPFNSNSACTTELYIVNCVHYTCVELQLLYAVVVFCNTFTERMHLQRNDAVL